MTDMNNSSINVTLSDKGEEASAKKTIEKLNEGKEKIKKPFSWSKFFVYFVLILQALLILVPFYIMLISSFKTDEELLGVHFTWFPTKGFDFSGYKHAFDISVSEQLGNVLIGFWNTMWMTVPTLVVGVIASGLSAYAYAKINFKGKGVFFGFTLFMMLVPGTVMIIPTYFMYKSIGWVGTPWPLVIPGLFGSAGMVFFLTQYMRGVPNEIFEAAEVDGLSRFGAFWRIMLPISVPAFIAQFILGFIGSYNSYLGPSLYLKGQPLMYTLQVVLRNIAGGEAGSVAVRRNMAGSLIAIVPLVILYLIFQDKIIDGVSVSGLSK